MLLEFEQNIEGCKTSVNAGDILLKIYFFFVIKVTGINSLFHDTQSVSHHYDLVEEAINGDFLILYGSVRGANDECAIFPFVAQGNHFGDVGPGF